VSRAHFQKYYLPPERVLFNQNAAIFPSGALKELVAREYEAQCELLCFGGYPR
jgi:hypothetical protein